MTTREKTMKRTTVFLLALLMAFPAIAEVYRWTDAQGGVHYSDSPPPPSAKKLKRIAAPESSSSTEKGNQPPVVLYNGNCGATCDQAADFLRQRKIPFTLKNANNDPKVAQELKTRTGALEIPVLFIGESMQRGYSPSIWDKMLDVAGYGPPANKEPATQSQTSRGDSTEPQ
jgi:arsenate reductase-like glutaredoxin family protein